MRRTTVFALLTLATATVVAGSYLWAWRTETFWKPLPLYPCVITGGLLALLAIYVNSRRFLRASWIGGGVALMTLVGTAIITLIRWDI